MNILEIILGQIPEAIYFALFLIFTKNLKTKRIIFILLSVVEYLLAFYTFPYSIYSHVLFFTTLFIGMKILYKSRCQIVDVFLIGIASILVIISSAIVVLVGYVFTENIVIINIVHKLLLFFILFVFNNKCSWFMNLYKSLWNRNDKRKNK